MSQNDIDLLDIRLLRLFDAIHATGSITRAADALDLSQPTVSIGLGRLRRHFGDPLFVRTPDGMLATPLADSLIGAIREAAGASAGVGMAEHFRPVFFVPRLRHRDDRCEPHHIASRTPIGGF